MLTKPAVSPGVGVHLLALIAFVLAGFFATISSMLKNFLECTYCFKSMCILIAESQMLSAWEDSLAPSAGLRKSCEGGRM